MLDGERGDPSRARRWLSLVALVGVLAIPTGACQAELRLDDEVDGGLDASGDAPAEEPPSPPEAQPGRPDAPVGSSASPGCTSDPDCHLSSLHCDTASGTCVQCVVDQDCAGGPDKRCDAALHQCVQCGVDGDCPSGQTCVTQTARCATSCTKITDCVLSGSLCDVTRDICIRCFTDAMCDLYPGQNRCAADGSCVACIADSDCSGSTPRCDQVNGTCVTCVSSADCPQATPLCDPASNTCTSG